MTTMNRTLVIMAKAPRLGAVKTRLAESFPPEAVTELYRCLLNDTIALAQTLHHVKIAMMCPASDVEDLSRVVAKTVPIIAQTGRGLAAGLASVFQHFAIPGHRGVIAFNSDSPHLPASVLEAGRCGLSLLKAMTPRWPGMAKCWNTEARPAARPRPV